MTAAQRLEDIRAASPWMTPAEAAVWAGGKTSTASVLLALQSGELRGYQRTKGGPWRVHRDAVDAWVKGEPYVEAVPVVTRRGRG